MEEYEQALLFPSRIPSASELLESKLVVVPKEPGVYAWYFKKLPTVFPFPERHHEQNGLTLLYIGIAPRRLTSSTNLRKRLNQHIRY